jgi:hypothetical protein
MAKAERRTHRPGPQMKRRNVYIVKHQTGSGIEYRLSPPGIDLTQGDEFRLVNTTNIRWRWTIHHGRPHAPAHGRNVIHWTGHVAPRGRATVMALYAAPSLRNYSYAVTAPGLTAKGFSDPLIIIDPTP